MIGGIYSIDSRALLKTIKQALTESIKNYP